MAWLAALWQQIQPTSLYARSFTRWSRRPPRVSGPNSRRENVLQRTEFLGALRELGPPDLHEGIDRIRRSGADVPLADGGEQRLDFA